MKAENDLILLEIGARLKRLEDLLELIAFNHKIHAQSITTLLEAENFRWRDGQNG